MSLKKKIALVFSIVIIVLPILELFHLFDSQVVRILYPFLGAFFFFIIAFDKKNDIYLNLTILS